jgi:hypothetical protein
MYKQQSHLWLRLRLCLTAISLIDLADYQPNHFIPRVPRAVGGGPVSIGKGELLVCTCFAGDGRTVQVRTKHCRPDADHLAGNRTTTEHDTVL